MFSSKSLVTILAMVGLLTACSFAPLHTAKPTHPGAVDARVLSIVTPETNDQSQFSCLKQVTATDFMQRSFYQVEFRPPHGNRAHIDLAEAPASLMVKVGDHVEILPGVCSRGGIGHVVSVLSDP